MWKLILKIIKKKQTYSKIRVTIHTKPLLVNVTKLFLNIFQIHCKHEFDS